MIYSSLSAGQLAFVIVVPIVVLVIIFLAIYIPVRKRNMPSNFRYFYYKKIYKVAMDKDYYLINNFFFKIDGSHVGKIDHILFADKYIYIIQDCYFKGDLDGKENDLSLIRITKEGKKNYEDNPLVSTRMLINKLCERTNINQDLIVGVCLINDECNCAVETTTNNMFIIQCSKFRKLVRVIESRRVGKINAKEMASMVKAIDKMNRRKHRNGRQH